MGNNISYYDRELNEINLNTNYKDFYEFVKDSLLYNASYGDITKVHLKRACCLRNNLGQSSISIPVLNLINNGFTYNDLAKSIKLNDIEKLVDTYTTITVNLSGMTDEMCTIANNSNQNVLYKPYDRTQTGAIDVCDKFYDTFCSYLYSDRVANKAIGNTVSASYFIPPSNASPETITKINNANWFSDCNCYNSVLKKRPDDIKSTIANISITDINDYSAFRDNNCGDRDTIKTTKPYWNAAVYNAYTKGNINCTNLVNLNNINA